MTMVNNAMMLAHGVRKLLNKILFPKNQWEINTENLFPISHKILNKNFIKKKKKNKEHLRL